MIPTYVGFTIACSRLIEYLVIWNILLIVVKRGMEFLTEIGSFWCFFLYRDILTEAATGGVLWKRMFLKFQKILRKTHGSHVSSFNKAWLWQRCVPVNFGNFLRTPFLQNTFEWLRLYLGPCQTSMMKFFSRKEFAAFNLIISCFRKKTHRKCLTGS